MTILNFYNLQNNTDLYFHVTNPANTGNNWVSDPYASSRPDPPELVGGGSSLGALLPGGSGPPRHNLWLDSDYNKAAQVRVTKTWAEQPGKILLQLYLGNDRGVEYLYYIFFPYSGSKKQGAVKVNGNKDFQLLVYDNRFVIKCDDKFSEEDGRVEEFGWKESLGLDSPLSKM